MHTVKISGMRTQIKYLSNRHKTTTFKLVLPGCSVNSQKVVYNIIYIMIYIINVAFDHILYLNKWSYPYMYTIMSITLILDERLE